MQKQSTGEAVQNAASLIQSLVSIARENGLFTLKAFAEKAGMKRPQLSRYVAGVDSPTLDTLIRLAAAAGATITIRRD